MLEGEGFEIVVAPTCERARALAVNGGFSLVVLDHELPDGDGVSLTRWMRSCPELESVPVIMCTASDDEETLQRSFEAGVTDFMRKPLRLTELKVRVMNAIQLYQATLGQLKSLQSAALANVVSVLAHEINNPLAVAFYCAERLEEELPQAGPRTSLLRKGLDRIRSLVADLRILALTDESAVEWTPVQDCLRLAGRILRVRNCGPLVIREHPTEDQVFVLAHPGLLAQAIMSAGHLLLNRAEQSGGGVLHLGFHQARGMSWVELRLELTEDKVAAPDNGPEPAQLVLARRRLAEFDAHLHAENGGATLKIQLIAAENPGMALERNGVNHVPQCS